MSSLRYCPRCDELTERTSCRQCHVCKRARGREHQKTEGRREARRIAQAKYNHSFKGVAAHHRYEEKKALERINQRIEEVLL